MRCRAKMLMKEKPVEILGRKTKAKQQTNRTIKLEEIKEKILSKEVKLKRYRNRVKQYKLNWTF